MCFNPFPFITIRFWPRQFYILTYNCLPTEIEKDSISVSWKKLGMGVGETDGGKGGGGGEKGGGRW